MSEESQSIYIYNGVDEVPMDVTHVRVDPSVTVIPSMHAFRNRRKLEVVQLPEGLIRIEASAFDHCESLKRINFPSTVLEIGREAFSGCNALEVVNLPEGLQSLGNYAFYRCTSLKTINIPSAIEKITQGVLLFCQSLSSITFSEGLREITTDSFNGCSSLSLVTLPPTLKVIGECAFECCTVLNEIQMHDDIETIKSRAFSGCNMTHFRIPPLITNVDVSILDGSRSMISLELPENISQIRTPSFSGNVVLGVLRNIALPTDCLVGIDILKMFLDLGIAFPDGDNTTISDALRSRFDHLPIHKICYYQSYHDNETTMQSLKREINPWTSNPPGQLNTSGKQHDCLGMTPLHILACSTKPTIEMYQILIEKYPETLIMKDKWGGIPLLYTIWCNSSSEVIDLLVESYKLIHPDYEFDWGRMLETLAKRNVSLKNIQKLINTQQRVSPDQKFDMQGIVLILAMYDTNQACFNKPCTAVDTFQYLLRISIAERLGSLAVSRWSEELEHTISRLPKIAKSRYTDTQAVYDRLATYESIKEGTSVLDLALWKSKIDSSRNKRARVSGEDTSYKEQCRINSGADIIIRNVLPYLMPK